MAGPPPPDPLPDPLPPRSRGPGGPLLRLVAPLRQLARDILALDRRTLAVLLTVPVVLTLLEYFGLPWHWTRWVQKEARITGSAPPHWVQWAFNEVLPTPELHRYAWWGGACLVLLVLLPMLVGAFLRASPRQLGLRIRGTGRDAWVYLQLYVVFFPVIWLISHRADFQKTYPFYKPPGPDLGQDFLIFEAIYCLQFFAIEFFFRGFMVLGLKPRLGKASVLVMIAPYCMIHYYKPFPEAMGAIGAGLVLGVLAWRTGTILYGWFLHYAVALSMDLLALAQR